MKRDLYTLNTVSPQVSRMRQTRTSLRLVPLQTIQKECKYEVTPDGVEI